MLYFIAWERATRPRRRRGSRPRTWARAPSRSTSTACARRRRPNGAAKAELKDEVSFVLGAEDMVSFEVSVTRR